MALMLRHLALWMYLKISQYVLAGLWRLMLAPYYKRGGWPSLRALKQSHEETCRVQRDNVEDHQTTEPLVKLGWKDACSFCLSVNSSMVVSRWKLTHVREKDGNFHERRDGSEEQLKRHGHLQCCK